MSQKAKKEDTVVYAIAFMTDEDDFLKKQSAKKGQTTEEYIHEASLNKSKKRYKDKLIKQDLVDTTADVNAMEADILADAPKEVLIKDINKIKEDLKKLWQR